MVNFCLLAQSLDVISVNFWHILISLANLILLFLLIKKFLYKPVKKMFETREKELSDKYAQADDAISKANADRLAWEEKLASAEEEANDIIKNATAVAKKRAEQIVSEADGQAEIILAEAQTEAKLELEKSRNNFKNEVVEVSTAVAEKMLNREVNKEDHDKLIDQFINELGEKA
ncbi:MAG: F0F1 ATP synthase subunit B [Clostridiales bacterium]|nr:F0F1 ATP synthase subunit B [Clostridiales bacterium]